MKNFDINNLFTRLESDFSSKVNNCKLKGKALENYKQKQLTILESEKTKINNMLNMELPNTIKIFVEWKKSSTWGSNPTATVESKKSDYSTIETGTGHASGCGYDKESSSVASAFRGMQSIKAILLKNADKLQELYNKKPYEVYGVDDETFSFNGGVGINCFTRIFENLGYNIEESHTNKTDLYFIYK